MNHANATNNICIQAYRYVYIYIYISIYLSMYTYVYVWQCICMAESMLLRPSWRFLRISGSSSDLQAEVWSSCSWALCSVFLAVLGLMETVWIVHCSSDCKSCLVYSTRRVVDLCSSRRAMKKPAAARVTAMETDMEVEVCATPPQLKRGRMLGLTELATLFSCDLQLTCQLSTLFDYLLLITDLTGLIA